MQERTAEEAIEAVIICVWPLLRPANGSCTIQLPEKPARRLADPGRSCIFCTVGPTSLGRKEFGVGSLSALRRHSSRYSSRGFRQCQPDRSSLT